jgi:hypothetical protein
VFDADNTFFHGYTTARTQGTIQAMTALQPPLKNGEVYQEGYSV